MLLRVFASLESAPSVGARLGVAPIVGPRGRRSRKRTGVPLWARDKAMLRDAEDAFPRSTFLEAPVRMARDGSFELRRRIIAPVSDMNGTLSRVPLVGWMQSVKILRTRKFHSAATSLATKGAIDAGLIMCVLGRRA